MKVNTFLYKYSFLLFILFFGCALVAFWPGYFSRLAQPMEPRNHTHGIGMTIWCIILICQAYLIRIKKYKFHKYIGWFSYVLIPYIIFSTVNLLHHLLGGAQRLSNGGYSFVTLVINSLVVFLILYALAIYHKKTPLIHARYMLSTIFPLVTPISDRIISRFFRSLVQYTPKIDGNPVIQGLGFYLVDFLLLILIIWDYKSHKRKYIFLTALVLNLIFQYSVLHFHEFEFWRNFVIWFSTFMSS